MWCICVCQQSPTYSPRGHERRFKLKKRHTPTIVWPPRRIQLCSGHRAWAYSNEIKYCYCTGVPSTFSFFCWLGWWLLGFWPEGHHACEPTCSWTHTQTGRVVRCYAYVTNSIIMQPVHDTRCGSCRPHSSSTTATYGRFQDNYIGALYFSILPSQIRNVYAPSPLYGYDIA